MQAIAEDCRTYKTKKLLEMKDQLRKSVIALDTTAEEFTRMFEHRYEIATRRISMLGEDDRSEMCKQMEALSSEESEN